MNTLIILMGPPGAGKTELAEYLHKKHPDSIIINKSEYLKKDNIKNYYNWVNKNLKEKDYVILDSQSVFYEDRIELFKSIDYKNSKVIGIWIEVSYKESDRRNSYKSKEEQLTLEEKQKYFKYKISPISNEPFDDIVYIIRDENIGMSISHPYMTTTFGALDRI